jgi:hypothetical protein
MLHAGAQPPFAGSRRRIGRNVADETLRGVELAHRYADLGVMRLRYVEAGRDRSCCCCRASRGLAWRRRAKINA